jgi:ABC-type nitrate/sulfonate/bicarbonate transport system permease component
MTTEASSPSGARAASWLLAAIPPLLLLIALLAAWELYVELSGINAVTLPAPSRVIESGWRARETLWSNGLVTLRETFIGLMVSVVFAMALALLIDAFAPARRALYPLLVGSQTIPIIVIAPLMLIWFGYGITPKIVVVTLYTFFPITVTFATGLASTDRDALVLMRTLGAGSLQTLRLLKIPHALPYFFTGLKIAVTYAVVGAVVAEWSGAERGLGIFVILMRNSFRTDLVIAAIFVIAALSMALFLLVGLIERLVVRWRT